MKTLTIERLSNRIRASIHGENFVSTTEGHPDNVRGSIKLLHGDVTAVRNMNNVIIEKFSFESAWQYAVEISENYDAIAS